MLVKNGKRCYERSVSYTKRKRSKSKNRKYIPEQKKYLLKKFLQEKMEKDLHKKEQQKDDVFSIIKQKILQHNHSSHKMI